MINLPAYTLSLYKGRTLVTSYPCRVGKPKTPTHIGHGIISDKRERVIFRYLSGEKKGQIIIYSYLDPLGTTIKMPYDKMRALGMLINNHDNQVIHATTDFWTVGTAKSHGCVGLTIEDMLDLFEKVKDFRDFL